MTNSITRFITGSSVMAAFTLALVLPGPALAQRAPATRLGGMQRHEQSEIRQGVQSGKLNKTEAANLERRQKTIQATAKQDKANGQMTDANAKHLKQELQVQNSAIKRAEGGGTNDTPPNH